MADYAESLPTAVRRLHRPSTPASYTSSLDPHDEFDRALVREERRRTKIVPNAFGEKPLPKLMFGALKGLNDAHIGCDMSIMGTGIYGATPRWTRIGAIMVVCFWYDALAADQLPRQIVGGWCLTSERPGKTYAYRRCKNGNYDIIVRWDGFDAQETSCELNTIKHQGAAWLASFGCSGAGLSWLEDDEIRISKDGWTLEAKIKNTRRIGDPTRYCLINEC